METRLAPPAFPSVGEALGDFQIVAELGRGSQGAYSWRSSRPWPTAW